MAVDNSWREPERSIWPFYDCLLVLRDIEESGQVTRSKWLHALDEVRLYLTETSETSDRGMAELFSSGARKVMAMLSRPLRT